MGLMKEKALGESPIFGGLLNNVFSTVQDSIEPYLSRAVFPSDYI